MDAQTSAAHARLLRIFAHPTRLMILAELLEAERCVNDIRDLLNVRQPNVSQHLAVLKESGLVASRKDGNLRCYHLTNPELVEDLFAALERHEAEHVGTRAAVPRTRRRKTSPSSRKSSR